MQNEVILVCYCPGIDKRAVATFKVVAKDHPVPPLFKGKYGIADFTTSLQKSGMNGEIIQYAQALAKSNEKFAYYMRWGVDGTVEVQYNLLTGRRTICSKN